MKRFIPLAALVVVSAACVAFVASAAQADVSNISVAVGPTSLTVSGIETDPAGCAVVRVEAANQPDGNNFDELKYASDGNWSVTFWDLEPGTYAVRVTDQCSPYGVDPFRELYVVPSSDSGNTGDDATQGNSAGPAPVVVVHSPDRYGFCSVAGNTWPDGTPIQPGTFLNLPIDQPTADQHYTGAVPGFFVEGLGITCSPPPGLAAASTLMANGLGELTPSGFYHYVPKS